MGTLITFSKWPCNSNSYDGTREPQVPKFSAKYIFALKKKKKTGTTKNCQSQANSVDNIFHFTSCSGTSTALFLKLLMCNSVSNCSWGQWAGLTGGGVWVTERPRELAAQGHSQVHSQMNPGLSPKAASWVQTSLPLIFQFISWPCASGIVLWNSWRWGQGGSTSLIKSLCG